jgi:hypothetical protein
MGFAQAICPSGGEGGGAPLRVDVVRTLAAAIDAAGA